MPEIPVLRFLSPEAVSRMLQMMQEKQPRPKVILDQEERIAAANRALEFKQVNGGIITQADIDEVVAMKFELDSLYTQWVEGKLDSKVEIVIARRQ